VRSPGEGLEFSHPCVDQLKINRDFTILEEEKAFNKRLAEFRVDDEGRAGGQEVDGFLEDREGVVGGGDDQTVWGRRKSRR
jgi:hypothetical protein